MKSRSIRNVHRSKRDDIGDLVTRRPVPNASIDQVDPFLFLNHHGPQIYPPGNQGLPFGPHPHRGFETVTFIVEGSLAHRDTGGHESVIHAGGVQWMTAGRGLEHAEVSPEEFLKRGGPLEILQLWVNLPPALKMVDPSYTGLQKNAIPSFTLDGGLITVNLISGSWNDHEGPFRSLTRVTMTTVELASGGTVDLPAPRGRSVFLYVVRGEVEAGSDTIPAFNLIEMHDDGDVITVASRSGSMVVFGHADPIGEPVVAHGPFVMNTREEIVQAVRDYQAGKFKGSVEI